MQCWCCSQLIGLYVSHFHIQSSITTIETKFAQADEELMQLRSNLKHYENLVDEYKSQVSGCRLDVQDDVGHLVIAY